MTTIQTKREVYHGGRVIAEDERYVLTRPRNSWDTNYHLMDKITDDDYLIDTSEVASNYEELEEYGCVILFSDMQEMDIDLLMEASWKKI